MRAIPTKQTPATLRSIRQEWVDSLGRLEAVAAAMEEPSKPIPLLTAKRGKKEKGRNGNSTNSSLKYRKGR